MRRVTVFVIAFVFWCLLVWPYGGAAGGLDLQSIIAGLGVALVTAVFLGDTLAEDPAKFADPRRWFWFIVYLPVFAWYCLKANLQMVYLVLHPKMPIRPGIVRIRTGLAGDTGKTALANSITLTPGTLTVDVDGDSLYVHWIYVEAEDDEGATAAISGRFEKFLKRITE